MEWEGPLWYDKKGRPVGIQTFGRLFRDEGYARIAQDDVLTPSGDMVWVSTVFIGINLNPISPVPIIFETMVFSDGYADGHCERYATEEAALAGHERIVAALKAGSELSVWVDDDP